MKTIHLPALERSVSLGAYVRAVKLAKENPDREFRHGLTCWWPCSGKDILRQFREGMTDRINQGIPYKFRGTPDSSSSINGLAREPG